MVGVAALYAVLVACTSAPQSVASSPTSGASGQSTAVAAGLVPVKDFAQEFCAHATSNAPCPKGSVPAALRRPFHLPSVAPDARCPVSQPNPRIWSRLAPGLGPGPVGPVGFGPHAILRYRHRKGSQGWGHQKVLWAASPTYDGPILIRGARIDGPGFVGFNLGYGAPLAELQLPPGSAPATGHHGWRGWPSYTRVRDPGCYAYQVDGTDFSYVIVFRAEPLA